MFDILESLSPSQWVLLGAFVVFSMLWSGVCGGLGIAGRRVPPVLALLPTALAISLAAAIAVWSAGELPYDTDTVAMTRRIQLATPDFLARAILFPAILPGLGILVLTGAIAAPLRGPRTSWPAGIGLLLGLLGFFALSIGAMLDRQLAQTGALLVLLGPLSLIALIGMVRGRDDSSGPEASLSSTVALGHAIAAGVVAGLAHGRYHQLLDHNLSGDPAMWSSAGAVILLLSVLGMSAAAATGMTATRARTNSALGALGTLLLWVPLGMVGALTQLV